MSDGKYYNYHGLFLYNMLLQNGNKGRVQGKKLQKQVLYYTHYKVSLSFHWLSGGVDFMQAHQIMTEFLHFPVSPKWSGCKALQCVIWSNLPATRHHPRARGTDCIHTVLEYLQCVRDSWATCSICSHLHS